MGLSVSFGPPPSKAAVEENKPPEKDNDGTTLETINPCKGERKSMMFAGSLEARLVSGALECVVGTQGASRPTYGAFGSRMALSSTIVLNVYTPPAL